MSSGRNARMKSKGSALDILDKKVPVNPKYKNIKPTVDTGASLSKYMQKIEEIRKNYRYKKDELFKRMKLTTFVQLVIQVAEYENLKLISTPVSTGRPDSADLEVQKIQAASPCPSLAVTEGDFGEPPSTSRSTLESVIRGVGEVDIDLPRTPTQTSPITDTCPYLLLDVRDKDAYDQCHIITALNYPTAMLSRTNNSERKEMLAYKNKPGRIILMYDYDEDIAPRAASTIVERGFDNLFMLSGGLKMSEKLFPECLLTGTPPQPLFGAKKKRESITMASQTEFSEKDLETLNLYLDKALQDHSIGSRLSKASCSSRSSYNSTYRSRSTPTLHSKPPFRA